MQNAANDINVREAPADNHILVSSFQVLILKPDERKTVNGFAGPAQKSRLPAIAG